MWLNIQGHDAVVEQFRRTLAAGRLASTYLFVGPEGIGKFFFAYRLAKVLLCLRNDPVQMSPCGVCDSCRLVDAGNHPDLDTVALRTGKRELLIEQFIGDREHRNQEGMCHNISLRPMLGSRRVAIIDDADGFNTASANCLLKVLEEPPPGAVIILIGTSRSRQLPTILSRAQVVRFHPLPLDIVSALLLAEGTAADEPTANRLAERSGGSLTRARDLADDALFEMRDRVTAQWASGSFDVARLARELDEFINAAGKEASARRHRLNQLFALVADNLAAMLRQASAAGDVDDSTLAAIDRTLEAQEQIDRNANQATLVESWLDDLADLLPAPPEPALR